jgi:hypothetical protein
VLSSLRLRGHPGHQCGLLSAVFSGAAVAQNTSLEGTKTIVFVCLHGSVNSQMAAAYFNKATQERGLPYTAISRGIDLHPSIPVRILDGLALDGLAPANSPHELTPADANGASKVLALDPVPVEQRGNTNINEYEAARDEIVRRIDELIPTLTADKRNSCRQGRS